MINEKSKKLFGRIMIGFGVLTLVLAIHLYWVLKPKPMNPNALTMARIDIQDSLNQQDVDKIQTWLHQQEGVNNVLVNPQSKIAVFTYYPSKTSGDQIVSQFQTSFNYKSSRFLPTEEEIAKGCDVMPDNVTKKITSYIKKTF